MAATVSKFTDNEIEVKVLVKSWQPQWKQVVVIDRNIVSLILRAKKKQQPEPHVLNRANSNFDAHYQIRCELSLDVCVVCGVAQRFHV
jgi:nicotinamide mononucleotide adenylyltransferase